MFCNEVELFLCTVYLTCTKHMLVIIYAGHLSMDERLNTGSPIWITEQWCNYKQFKQILYDKLYEHMCCWNRNGNLHNPPVRFESSFVRYSDMYSVKIILKAPKKIHYIPSSVYQMRTSRTFLLRPRAARPSALLEPDTSLDSAVLRIHL